MFVSERKKEGKKEGKKERKKERTNERTTKKEVKVTHQLATGWLARLVNLISIFSSAIYSDDLLLSNASSNELCY